MLLGVVAHSDVDANVEEALLLLGTIESANDENARAWTPSAGASRPQRAPPSWLEECRIDAHVTTGHTTPGSVPVRTLLRVRYGIPANSNGYVCYAAIYK